MALHQVASVIGGILGITVFIPYALGILRGVKSQFMPQFLLMVRSIEPQKSTWIIWATLDTITFWGMYKKHSLNGQIIGVVIGGWIVVGLCLKYGKPGWTWLEKLVLAGAAIGFAVMWFNPVYGLVTSLSVALLGSVPTFLSTYKDPSSEDKLAWMLYFLSCISALIGVEQWDVAHAAAPVVFTIIETIMVYLTWIRPRFTTPVPAHA